MNKRFNLVALIEELEEQKKLVMSEAQAVKKDFLNTMEEIEGSIEEIDIDEVKTKAIVLQLKVREELEEIQQVLSDFSEKTKEVADISQATRQENGEDAKKMMAKAENKLLTIFNTIKY